MKIIVHIELSDSERSHLAANTGGTHPVTRKEVTKLVNDFIQEKLNVDVNEAEHEPAATGNGDPGERGNGGGVARVPENAASGFSPSRGDEDYIAQPSDAGIAAACSRILDDTALIEQFAWDTVERNRK